MRIENNSNYIAIPRIFKLRAMYILEAEGIEYQTVNKDNLPDGKYELSAVVKGKTYHCPQVAVLLTKANKEDLIKLIEESL